MEDRKLTEKESLEVITSMIALTKQRYIGDGRILLLFGYLLYRLFVVAQNAPDAYGMLMVSGVFAHISIQVILNLCVVLKLMPATGITLPFISYGGTSVLFILTEIGIALCVSRFIVFQDGKSGEGEAQAEE